MRKNKKVGSFIYRKYRNRIGLVSVVDGAAIGGVGERSGVCIRVCV